MRAGAGGGATTQAPSVNVAPSTRIARGMIIDCLPTCRASINATTLLKMPVVSVASAAPRQTDKSFLVLFCKKEQESFVFQQKVRQRIGP
jgi:hypothetical protein